MISDREYDAKVDYTPLALSLIADAHHKTTTPEFFSEPGTSTKVYEDGAGQIVFVRGTPVLRLDLQFVDNGDWRRNMAAMVECFPSFAAKAKEDGWREIVFNTSVPALKKFCIKRLGFNLVEGEELRKTL